jgi:hypothetical protein
MRKRKKGKNQKIRLNPDMFVALVPLNKVTQESKIKEPEDTSPEPEKSNRQV